jgi:beta-glucosidase
MPFVPVEGTKAWFCVWDVRVRDYATYEASNAGVDNGWQYPNFDRDETHPVVKVSWEDAKAFCRWLTAKERSAGVISTNQSYRLPTDVEWSVAVGLQESNGGTPGERNERVKGIYPSGTGWPLPRGAGNYGGALHIDDYPFTSPVGSFAANHYGLYDMGGNVWQWCEDWYDSERNSRVLRGASWFYFEPDKLLSSARDFGTPDYRSIMVGFRCVLEAGDTVLWKDPAQPLETRVHDLVSRMSLPEKIGQLRSSAPSLERLGLPAYDYCNECLHGVGRAGVATVFPQAIGLAATWNTSLVHEVAGVIATEARVKHEAYAALHDGNSIKYAGLTFWSPNINLFRDPRWGRGQETYGEDPFLTSRFAVEFIRGLQGDGSNCLKTSACAKHFAVHSGPERERHRFNVEPSERDLYECYLPQFEAAVREGKVGGVMGAYNRLNGEPACSSSFLLTELLRRQWGFTGYVVSDCGAISDIYAQHHVVATPEEAAARALRAGCDLCCGNDYDSLAGAVQMGLITEKEIDKALQRVLEVRFRLGLLDPTDDVACNRIPLTENDTSQHERLALRAARESIVLLKNDGTLPLDRTRLKRIAVIGMNAVSLKMLVADYHGIPARPVDILAGLKQAAGPGIEVGFEPGCPLTCGSQVNTNDSAFVAALDLARRSDVVIYAGGLSGELEGEESSVELDGFSGGDRTRIELPAVQTTLLKGLKATGKPVVFVLCGGSAVAMPWEAENLSAILEAWYPGEQGGRAVAEVLFGDYNPAGRLPITFYQGTSDLPSFANYSMSNRTYRFFGGNPLFAFGHGLSYTRFEYVNSRLDSQVIHAGETLRLTFGLKNTGQKDGDEVAQVYYRPILPHLFRGKLALCGFARAHVPRGAIIPVIIDIPIERFRSWNPAEKRYVVETGDYEILLAASSDDVRSQLLFKVEAEAALAK